MSQVSGTERATFAHRVHNRRGDRHRWVGRFAVLAPRAIAMAGEVRPVISQVDRRLFVPTVHQHSVGVKQLAKQRGRVIGHARLQHQLGVLPHQVDRVVLDASDVADEVENAGLARKRRGGHRC